MTAARPLRADAARNRKLLLAAAADEFAEHGLDASVADIARRAGVGKGTVFRHFATKDELVAAILIDRMEALSDLGERLYESDDADAAMREFLTAAAMQRQERDLSFLAGASESMADVNRARERMTAAIDRLVARARERGAMREDVTGTDVFLLMCAPNYVAGYVPNASPDLWRRYLALILDGLRPEGARPLPEAAPDLG
ncbi:MULTISPECIES: TetR/AcrR family transcriptional regulator [Glycomyces]|uniref:AcrR family transcriptional regulator n=2 Tax=Glycomyces TaxID=58113 RepID=A0A9X3PGT2_9ACTN|nr:TetR/AcrR family transcriptional regulator [Glycomyces lechevalierae]MDA1383884.1 helix-turn-helix domain containing protein [Glycomyces lechevalierae]MDR7341124.1 AcrR family transcriptional regulator [Glycomyces lechevalierae]